MSSFVATRFLLPHAAWVVQARGIVGLGRRAPTGLFNRVDRILRAVRGGAVEHERLLEANKIGVVSAGKHFGLDLVEPPTMIEHCDRRAAAVLRKDAELTAVDLVDAVREVDLHLAAFRHRLDRKSITAFS